MLQQVTGVAFVLDFVPTPKMYVAVESQKSLKGLLKMLVSYSP
jgi:hypothetical protein